MSLSFSHPWCLLALAPLGALVLWLAWTSRGAMAPWRFWSSLVSRGAMVLAIVLALAGLLLVHSKDELAVFFLVDVSKSVDPDSQRSEMETVAEIMKTMDRRRDWAGLIVFGGVASVEQPLRKELPLTLQSLVNPDFTDISQAIRLAMASFPEDLQKRIVLLSDGQENLGDALEAARAARAAGIEVWTVPTGQGRDRDVAVQKVSVPADVKLGESFDVLVHYKFSGRRPGESQPGKLRVYRNRQYLGDLDVELQEGEGVIRIPQKIRPAGDKPGEGAGFYQYEVLIETAHDAVSENNRGFGFTSVAGEARILLVEGKPGQSEPLEKALRAGGVKNLEVRPPTGFPSDMISLQVFDAVIFSDVSAHYLSGADDGQLRLIHDYVESHGGGFVMIGGESSFGSSYFRTPVEEALPVSMDIRKKKMRASLALVIGIDQSGSMSMTVPDGRSKLQLVSEASCQIVDLLTELDKLGICYIDTQAMWAYHCAPLVNTGKIKADLRSQRGGGGGIYCFTALDALYRELDKIESAIKHVILFADASDAEQPDGCVDRARRELAKGRTLTVIGMGTDKDSDAKFLQDLAKAGNGRIYFCEDVRKLPKIFTEDTLIASKSAIVEKDFKAEVAGASSLIEGIDWKDAPILHGYVTTTLKPRGEMLLKGLDDDPLLAKWQYGLGRTVAFTSDAKPKWAKEWIDWAGYRNLWPQVVRWAARRRAATDYRTQVSFEGGKGKVVIDAFDAGGEAQNFLDLEARVTTSEGKTARVRLTQQGTGRYEGEFPADSKGAYLATVADREGSIVGQAGAAVSYSPEYEIRDERRDLLEELARATGGKSMAVPRGVFEHPSQPARSPQEIWRALLGFAIACLLVDVASRRLGIPEMTMALIHRLRRTPALAPPMSLPEPIARLKVARDEAKAKTVQPLPEAPPTSAAPIASAPAAPKPSEPPPPPAPAPDQGYLGRLLDAKKRAKGEK